jgi:hypothetical protein
MLVEPVRHFSAKLLSLVKCSNAVPRSPSRCHPTRVRCFYALRRDDNRRDGLEGVPAADAGGPGLADLVPVPGRQQELRFAVVLRDDLQHPVIVDLVRAVEDRASVCCTHSEFHPGSVLSRRLASACQPGTPLIQPSINLAGQLIRTGQPLQRDNTAVVRIAWCRQPTSSHPPSTTGWPAQSCGCSLRRPRHRPESRRGVGYELASYDRIGPLFSPTDRIRWIAARIRRRSPAVRHRWESPAPQRSS